ncbi:UvrB/UvrC motif-containing protein, partial [Sulfurivirga sp.]|uniref:UvrB/UvrC motif-containing protein n=1 Tax=Sulfurivirga sp. TaxID=2614236 RepID=UPI0025D54769
AARNPHGRAILYADQITDSMRRAIDETERRREKQMAYNSAHGITPRGLNKKVGDILEDSPYAPRATRKGQQVAEPAGEYDLERLSPGEAARLMKKLEKEMYAAARDLEFEKAAQLRDQLKTLRAGLVRIGGT